MLPVMFAARKIDGEDPNNVYWLRVAYGTIQMCCLLVVIYTYIQASSAASIVGQGVVYVPAPAVVRILVSILVCSGSTSEMDKSWLS